MTKSTGVGRGGRRPGAGRKPSRKSTEAIAQPVPAPKPKRPPKAAPPPEKPARRRSPKQKEPVSPPPEEAAVIPTEAQVLDAVKAGCIAAVKALVAVAAGGSDSARVQAAEKLLKWGFGSPKEAAERARATKVVEPKPEREPQLGKKEQRQLAAEKRAVGRLAPPPAPRLAVDNT